MLDNKFNELVKEIIPKNSKYVIRTYGCQMNEHDSEQVEFLLNNLGMEKVDDYNEADFIIINTCAIRGTAENKALGFLGSLKNLKRQNPDIKIIVSGCLPKVDGTFEDLIKKNRHIDILIGTSNYLSLPELIYRSYYEDKTIVDISDQYDLNSAELNYNRMYEHKSFVNIMYGCNNFCSYCIVPYTRGREYSREVEDIVKEIEVLVADGVKEITLLGQNVNSYGKSLDEKSDFPSLLREINKIDGIERIRFMTSHPKDFSDDLIKAYSDLDKLCKQLHLPVQSGSNKVLEEMNRKYTRESYLDKINKIKALDMDIAISTDIIVGFPGESDEDFEDTLDLIRSVEYDSIFSFLYSPREGTPAAKREDQVPHEVKMNRFNRLMDLTNEIAYKKNLKLKDKIVKVLVDEVSKNNPEFLSGRTDGFKTVNFPGDPNLIGKIVDVEIEKVGTFSLDGRLIWKI